jgi:hypothetical protein
MGDRLRYYGKSMGLDGEEIIDEESSHTNRSGGLRLGELFRGVSDYLKDKRKSQLPRSQRDTGNPGLRDMCRESKDTGSVIDLNHTFMLLCMPFMRWATKVQQPDVCKIYSDRDFFRLLKASYMESRKGYTWRGLKQVRSIDFVMVCNDTFCLVFG